MYTVYILHSEKSGRYYTGFTSGKVEDRLSKHLCNHGGFTSNIRDWRIIWSRAYVTKEEAILEEKRIKKRGARRYLNFR